MSMQMGSHAGVSSEMNVTPLIDVLLVLLIIFMTILPVVPTGEQAEIPQPTTQRKTTDMPGATIVIQVRDEGAGKTPALKINNESATWADLESRLAAIFKTRVERVAFIQGDPEVDFEFVAQAIDLAHAAGADRVGLLGADAASR